MFGSRQLIENSRRTKHGRCIVIYFAATQIDIVLNRLKRYLTELRSEPGFH